jgi:hypothetical protein
MAYPIAITYPNECVQDYRHRKIRVLGISLAFLFPVVLCTCGFQYMLLSYLLGLLGVSTIPLATARLLRHPYHAIDLAVCAYQILAFTGLVIMQDSLREIGNPFSFRGDDLLYFSNAVEVAHGVIPEQFTPFDLITALAVMVNQVLGIESELGVVLPMSWMISAVCVALAAQFATQILSEPVPPWIVLVPTLGNVTFLETGAELFRDGFVCLLFLLMLAAAIHRRVVWILVFFLICLFVRGGAAYLGLAGAGLLYVHRYLHSRREAVLLLCLLAALSPLVMASSMLLAYIQPWRTETQTESFGELLSHRESLVSEHDVTEGSATRSVVEMGWKGYVLRPFVYLFAPIRVRSLTGNVLVVNGGSITWESVTRYFLIFWTLTVVLWVIVAPRLMLGIVKGLQSTNILWFLVTCIFLLTLLAISFVSFQDRHKMMFIALFPILLSFAASTRRTTAENTIINVGMCVTALILLLVNRSFSGGG